MTAKATKTNAKETIKETIIDAGQKALSHHNKHYYPKPSRCILFI
ncbi:MAG: hypothetical protein PF482_12290 [Desulfobacteraceae bacterium]|jgi:hypothetical protein|nr:hypothetical protein [Desulfobacteraceae bacterium]